MKIFIKHLSSIFKLICLNTPANKNKSKFFKKKSCQIIKICYNSAHKAAMLIPFGVVAELVDALDLGSSAARCESSSLSDPTILKPCSDCKVFLCPLVKLYRHRLSAAADVLIGICGCLTALHHSSAAVNAAKNA